MSEMAKNARAAMKAKATRMGGKGDPKAKVDASSWSPPEMMNTGAKVGMRPLSRRAFRKGGKVIEKCEGGPAAMRADRKQRKAGGRATSLVTDMINRNVKKANKYREGGDAHVGGYKSGGDVEQDKKLVKKAFRQHDEHMHGGKHEDIKLKKGGRTKKAAGGTPPPADTAPEPEPKYEDWRKLQTGKGPAPGQGDKTSPPGGTMMPKKAKGGGTYFGGTRPTGGRMPKAAGGRNTGDSPRPAREIFDEMYAKKRSEDEAKLLSPEGETGRQARNAMMLAKMRQGRKSGGRMPKAAGGKMVPLSSRQREIAEDVKNSTRPADDSMKTLKRARGGRAKGKTNISITINPQRPQDQQQQAMMPKMPTPPPMPPPPIAPPGMGPGMPPMPMPPPGGMPPGLGGPPPGMPPMPRKRGGRAYRSYKDMDAGALGGMGRLEKVEIEHGKRVGRLSGGRARSYKDMDAGSLGGMGRIEKTAIQKHKR